MANCRKCGQEMSLMKVNDLTKGMNPYSGTILRHNGHPVMAAFATALKIAGSLVTVNDYYCGYCDSSGTRIKSK